MKGDPEVIDLLNEVLTSELTAINQYWIHYKMCQDWGYERLAAHHRAESIDEMKHADQVIERILYLDGIPNMQRYGSVKVGQDVVEQHEVDKATEEAAIERLNRGIKLCVEKGDNATRQLLENILVEEEEGLDWIEGQLHQINEVGREHYIAQQIHPDGKKA